MEDGAGSGTTLGPSAERVLGKRVSELRRARGWSQDEVARRMTDAGFSWRQTTVAKTEKADRPVRVNEAAALADLFEMQLEHLVTPDQPPLIEKLDDARQQLRAMEAEADRARVEAERKDITREFFGHRVKALEAVVAFWREPSAVTLFDAALGVLYWCAEWDDLLAEAGVPREVLKAAEKKAFDQQRDEKPQEDEGVKDQLYRIIATRLVEWFQFQEAEKEGGEDGERQEAT